MNLILFLAGVFLVTFILGRLLEKIRVPWVFSALLIGLGLAAYNPFESITSSSSFHLLAQLGMYFLMFIIGFELDLKEVKRSSKFLFKTTMIIIVSEAIVGSLIVHYLFDVSWIISGLVALSFATVGEAVLIPILEEFKLMRTRLGQTIIGVGVLDDIIEVITIILLSIIVGYSVGHGHFNIWGQLGVLFCLFFLAFLLIRYGKYLTHYKYKKISSFFIFVIFFIFLFVGIGLYVESAALGALLAGISLRTIIPRETLDFIESEIKTMAYGFFAPIFFLWVGVDTEVSYMIKFPVMIILILVMVNTTKITGSYIAARKKLGDKKAILLGISLCVKFSTSIVIIKMLFEKELIGVELYSVLIGATVAFKFVVPFLLAHLIKRWNIGFKKLKRS